MIGFFGYNFCGDANCIDPYPTNVQTITSTKIKNSVVYDLYITQDTDSELTPEVPTEWDFNTILLANFNGNLQAGNVAEVLKTLKSIRIKRRPVGGSLYDWVTLKDVEINDSNDLSFTIIDNLAKNNTQYEYAWIPVLDGGTEGNAIKAEVLSRFNGVFIADADSIYKYIAGVGYGQTQRVQQVGTFEPYGRKYPVYVANGAVGYESGSVNATIVGKYLDNPDQNKKYQLVREDMVAERENLFDFLTNKKAKIIKDWNGNYWLVVITGNPSVDYDNNWGMGVMNANFQWSEIGDAENAQDMKSSGLTL